MKILIFNWQDTTNPLAGGAEVHLHEIFKRIVAMGHDVTLYCNHYDKAPKEESLNGIRVIREGGRNDFNVYVPLRYFTRFRKEKFDIIIDDINKIPFYTPLYVKGPLLGISHHFFGKSIFREIGYIMGSYVYAAEKVVDCVYKSTPMVVVSDSTLKEFVARGFKKENFSIVRNCIDQSKFPMKMCNKNPQPTVAYFGRLKKYKSVDHLLEAFAKALQRVPNAQLHIIGAGDFRPALESLAATLNISKQTTFFGFVSEEEKIRLLSEAWCMANTSMKEGWGITNIEANACGTPVISSNSPGLRDAVQDGKSGLLYEYGNIDEFSNHLVDIFTDEKLRSTLSHGAVEWAKEFSWDHSAQLMIDRCSDVVEKYWSKRVTTKI